MATNKLKVKGYEIQAVIKFFTYIDLIPAIKAGKHEENIFINRAYFFYFQWLFFKIHFVCSK